MSMPIDSKIAVSAAAIGAANHCHWLSESGRSRSTRPNGLSDSSQCYTRLGTLPVSENTARIALCPPSAVGPNMHGQPPSMTVMACSRP
jgi:hypothetical protein